MNTNQESSQVFFTQLPLFIFPETCYVSVTKSVKNCIADTTQVCQTLSFFAFQLKYLENWFSGFYAMSEYKYRKKFKKDAILDTMTFKWLLVNLQRNTEQWFVAFFDNNNNECKIQIVVNVVIYK